MRKTITFAISIFMISTMLSGCIVDPWWWGHGGHGGRGGGHGDRR